MLTDHSHSDTIEPSTEKEIVSEKENMQVNRTCLTITEALREIVYHQKKLCEVVNDIKIDLFNITADSMIINQDLHSIIKTFVASRARRAANRSSCRRGKCGAPRPILRSSTSCRALARACVCCITKSSISRHRHALAPA